MPVKVKFDKEGLEDAVRLLRIVSGVTGPNITEATAVENIREVLILTERLDSGGETGNLIDIKSRVVTADGTNEPETWVVLQPTEALILRAAAIEIGIRTPDRDLPVGG